jgi:hypothetical protein
MKTSRIVSAKRRIRMPGGQSKTNTDLVGTGPIEIDPVLGYEVSAEFHAQFESDLAGNDNVAAPQVSDPSGAERNMTQQEINAGEVHG